MAKSLILSFEKPVSGKMSSNLEWFKNEVLEFLGACEEAGISLLSNDDAIWKSKFVGCGKEAMYETFDVMSFLVNRGAGITIEQAKEVIDLNVWGMLRSSAVIYINAGQHLYVEARHEEWVAKKIAKYGIAEWREKVPVAIEVLANATYGEAGRIWFIEWFYNNYK